MDGIIRTFTRDSVLELIDQAVGDIIQNTSKWRRDRHFPLKRLKEIREQQIKELIHYSTLAGEPYVIPIDDEDIKNETMGKTTVARGIAPGLEYYLYYYRDPTPRGRSQRSKNIPSRLRLEFRQLDKAGRLVKIRYIPKIKLVQKRKIKYLEGMVREEKDEEVKREMREYLEKVAERETCKKIIIEINLGVPERKRKGRKLKNGKYSHEVKIKEMRLLERNRRKDGEPPHWITPKQLWIPPFKDTSIEYIRSYARFWLAFYLLQENIVEWSKEEICEIFEEYFKLLNINREDLLVPEYLLSLLSGLYTDFDLPQDCREPEDTILKLRRKFLPKIITDDLEKIQEEQSVDAAVSQLGTEGLEVSRDTIYRWIRERKVPVTQNRRGKIRLTQEGIERIQQLQTPKQKRKAAMDYLIEEKGLNLETARKRIHRHPEEIDRLVKEAVKNKDKISDRSNHKCEACGDLFTIFGCELCGDEKPRDKLCYECHREIEHGLYGAMVNNF